MSPTPAEVFVPSDDVLADDGYPSDAELATIRAWPILELTDCERLMEYVEARWWMAEWGWRRERRRRREWKAGPLRWYYRVSTGGWSGNEDIIGALSDNVMWWTLCWISSERGGHFRFRLP